jgi:tRNA pseudouridine55 synthase
MYYNNNMENTKNNLTGILAINKPERLSSFDCIRHIKRILKQKIKIGHTGTLDNFATGLLIICIGRQATKLVSSLMNKNKEYIVKAKLGELTNTLDYTGKIVEKIDVPNLTQKDIEGAIKKLGSSYMQIPPVYSALKYKGSPLYKLARQNKLDEEKLQEIVQLKSRKVTIYEIELLDFTSPFFTIRAKVSKGTYIRSLANDIAQQLNLPATTYELERTKIGNFSLQNSVHLDDIKSVNDIINNLISIEN